MSQYQSNGSNGGQTPRIWRPYRRNRQQWQQRPQQQQSYQTSAQPQTTQPASTASDSSVLNELLLQQVHTLRQQHEQQQQQQLQAALVQFVQQQQQLQQTQQQTYPDFIPLQQPAYQQPQQQQPSHYQPRQQQQYRHRQPRFYPQQQSQSYQSHPPVAAGGRSFHSSANDAKRRKLPHFLSPEEANQPPEQDDEFLNSPSTNNSHQPQHSSTRYQQPPHMHRAASTPTPPSNVLATSASAAAAQPWRSQSQTIAPSFSLTQQPITFLPPPPALKLPANFPIHYASNQNEFREYATELLQILRAELNDRAAPATSQHPATNTTCDCPAVVGFDLEWKPNYVKGESQNPVALLQLSLMDRAYLFQLTRCLPNTQQVRSTDYSSHDAYKSARHAAAVASLGPLGEILLHPGILKVGIGIKGDVAKFLTDYGLHVQGSLCLSDYANERFEHDSHHSSTTTSSTHKPKRVPSRVWGLAALLSHTHDGVEMLKPKKIRMSNWESYLSYAQQQYAALDAWASLSIYERLHRQHQQQRNCNKALRVGLGIEKRARSPSPIPIEVVVRKNESPSTDSQSENGDLVDLTLNSPPPSRNSSTTTRAQPPPRKRERTFEVIEE